MLVPGLIWTGFIALLPSIVLCGDDFIEFLQTTKPIATKRSMNDDNLLDLNRDMNLLGTLPDSDWAGIADKKIYNYNENNKVDKATGHFFRNSNKKSRGSKAKLQTQVVAFQHKADPNDPPGCGNPVCVVIDRKPRRFKSICQLKTFLKHENRLEQVNFVQKGDCYDIIDNAAAGGALKKPWSDNAQDCSKCAADASCCNGPVTVIIDINSYMQGVSSAPGGGIHNEAKFGGKKMAGFPFEFCNICEAMKFFQSVDNVNTKTQVVGIAFGSVNKLFPLAGGDNCLWTEYFDHDSPCNSNEDKELHSEHFRYLQSSYTGALRVCEAEDIIDVCHEGGSEITQIKAEDAMAGQGVGVNGTKFDQKLQKTKQSIVCKNLEQTIKQLPPPFIYADDKNNTCLDYKARYCCRTSKMWRPMGIDVFGDRIPPTVPFGAAVTTYKKTGDTICFTVSISDGIKNNPTRTLKLSVKVNTNNGEIIDGKMISGDTTSKLPGTYTKITRPDKSSSYTFSIFNPNTKDPQPKQLLSTVNIYLHWDPAALAAVATTIKDEAGLISTTQVLPAIDKAEALEPTQYAKPAVGYRTSDVAPDVGGGSGLFDDIKWDMRNTTLTDLLKSLNVRPLYYQTVMVDNLGGVKTIVSEFRSFDQFMILKSEGALNIKLSDNKNMWKTISAVLKTYSISVVVESPPLAVLFHECEWKDWVDRDYPANLHGTDGEFELRDQAAKEPKLVRHVCGTIPESAHYVDAITKEDRVPWYELKMGLKIYQTFKLTPFFGYACQDKNGPKEFCKDMKIRYCCEKALRATWGEWGAWSDCNKSCGGGEKKRKRDCVQDEAKKNSPKYIAQCYGQDENAKASTAERYSSQTEQCNLESCPEDHKFMPWTGWTACSLSCGQGTKTKTRYCLPALGGGQPCPEELTNRDLYVKVNQCTQKDCEHYIPTQWGAWSSCSTTCGKGQVTRYRKCQNDKTYQLVPNDRCTNGQAAEAYFAQTQNCFQKSCPVNGKWAAWSQWGLCNQDCIDEPEPGQPITTKAFRKRERWCTNPATAFQGKPCPRDAKYEFNSRQYSETEKTACITPNSKEKGPVTKWCPVHCIYTQWGEWSLCSKSCVRINAEVKQFQSDKLMNFVSYKYDANSMMPTRSRVKILIREAKNGGKCEEKDAYFDQPGSFNGTTLIQPEQCKLCKEHCPIPTDAKLGTNVAADIRSFPKLDYPGQDASCVGYCPESCKWSDFKVQAPDCSILIKKYLEERKAIAGISGENVTGACYDFTFRKDAFKNKAQEIMIAFDKYIQPIADGKVPFPLPAERTQLPANILKMLDEEPDLAEELNHGKFAFVTEMNRYHSLLFGKERKTVEIQYVDGLMGGAPCVTDDKREVTSFAERYKKDKKKYTKKPWVETTSMKCSLLPCNEPINPGNNVQTCKYTQWTEWGSWGKCSAKCGDDGTRQRKRKCINTCDNSDLPNEECKPLIDPGRNRTWTDSMDGRCIPCPAESAGSWSLWTTWTYSAAPRCTDGKAKTTQKRTRERRCIPGPDVIECSPTAAGLKSGVDKEVEEIPEPPCGGAMTAQGSSAPAPAPQGPAPAPAPAPAPQGPAPGAPQSAPTVGDAPGAPSAPGPQGGTPGVGGGAQVAPGNDGMAPGAYDPGEAGTPGTEGGAPAPGGHGGAPSGPGGAPTGAGGAPADAGGAPAGAGGAGDAPGAAGGAPGTNGGAPSGAGNAPGAAGGAPGTNGGAPSGAGNAPGAAGGAPSGPEAAPHNGAAPHDGAAPHTGGPY